ncbi:MAG: nitroreductase family deazaflavin-dependent oxidoreductase [Actinomycetota bacterium]|nr:nitroreductase family deazaflavin-dependent oxidoreductase [Actinomycetota bacterium]
MMKQAAQILGGVILALAALAALFVISMRMKYPPVLTAIRRFNRAVTNPQAMKTAGQPGASASTIQHVGRTSGASYETPIDAVPADGGFVIPLPYGTTSDWLKNVLAAGSAVIISEGVTYQVDHPELIPSETAFPYVPAGEQRALRAFAVDQFLRVRSTHAG